MRGPRVSRSVMGDLIRPGSSSCWRRTPRRPLLGAAPDTRRAVTASSATAMAAFGHGAENVVDVGCGGTATSTKVRQRATCLPTCGCHRWGRTRRLPSAPADALTLRIRSSTVPEVGDSQGVRRCRTVLDDQQESANRSRTKVWAPKSDGAPTTVAPPESGVSCADRARATKKAMNAVDDPPDVATMP